MKAAVLCLAIGAALLSGMAAADGFWPQKGGAASNSHDLLKADEAFHLVAAERDGQVLKVSWDIAPGYYLYRKRISVRVLTPTGMRLDAPQLPKGEMVQDEQGTAEIYHGSLQAALRWPKGSTAPQRLQVSYQGCAEAGVCYPPQTRQIDVIDLSH